MSHVVVQALPPRPTKVHLMRAEAVGSSLYYGGVLSAPRKVVSLQLQELQRVGGDQDQDPYWPQGGVSAVLGFRGRALVEAPPRAEAGPRGGT